MEALAGGFCAAALTQTLAAEDVVQWHQRWQQPVLQVVDIQRYPRLPTVASGPSRFYLAASDGQSLAWLLVPPHTPLEEAIASFELEVGCCVTLVAHTLVTAANGRNVVVPLQVKYTANTLRVLGQPAPTSSLFPLSSNSLLQRSAKVEEPMSSTASASVRRTSHRVMLRDFVDNPERALGNWSIEVRVVWRGREYPLTSAQRSFGSSSFAVSANAAPRFVFRCLLVDERGDGVVAAFYGGEAMLDVVQLHDCLLLAQGTVKWGVGEVAAPVELQFTEKSVEVLVEQEERSWSFPRFAAALVGGVAEELRSVATVMESAGVGDVTSVVGVVTSVQSSAQITTKRGRVWRSVVALTDGDDEAAPGGGRVVQREREGLCCVEVTLWGDIAEATEPAVGERWVFHSCIVNLFQQRKTLSTRASSMVIQLRPLPLAHALQRGSESGADAGALSSASQGVCTDAVGASTTPQTATTDAENFVQSVLNLHEASPSLPVLARVQEVGTPLLTWTCTTCSSVVWGAVDTTTDCILECCDGCGAAELFPSLNPRVWLSDGLSSAEVRAHGSAAEALLGVSAMELARALERSRDAGTALRASLTGIPVLMWLLPDAEHGSEAPSYIATACKRIDYAAGSQTLLTAMETFVASADSNGAAAPSAC